MSNNNNPSSHGSSLSNANAAVVSVPGATGGSTTTGSSGRSWLEGTLDVISGSISIPRPSTPVLAEQQQDGGIFRRIVRSTPNSPSRPAATKVPPPVLVRLPSQDSLDCSIHNESNHGKSTAQIIQSLKQSNARLSARTAALEADFMNQLQDATRDFESRQKDTQKLLQERETQFRRLESKCKNLELRLAETSEQNVKIKEESAFQRHTISDLKQQLVQASADKRDGGDTLTVQELQNHLVRAQEDARKHEEESKIWKQLFEKRRPTASNTDDANELSQTQDALYRTETALVELQNAQRHVQSQHEQTVDTYKSQLNQTQQSWQDRESQHQSELERQQEESKKLMENLQSQLRQADETVQSLRDEILDYSRRLTEQTAELAALSKAKAAEDAYRREEADDLRLLNDAQEEEIHYLKKQLEDAMSEVEVLREQLLEHEPIAVNTRDGGVEEKKEDSSRCNQLEQELEQTRVSLEATKAHYENRNEALINELEHLKAQRQQHRENESSHLPVDQSKHYFEGLSKDFEAKIMEKESELESKYKTKIADLHHEAALLRESERKASRQVADLELELELHKKSTTAASSYTSRLPVLEAENDEEPDKIHRAGGSSGTIDDLHKQLAIAQQAEEQIRSKLNEVEESMKSQEEELRSKLSDRDSTISTLVKSAVTLEEELASTREELRSVKVRLCMDESGGEETGFDMVLRTTKSEEELQYLYREIDHLRNEIDDLHQENNTMSSQLEGYKNELFMLRARQHGTDEETASAGGGSNTDSCFSGFSASPAKQIQERDKAIANLVQQAMDQDRLLADLRRKLTSLTEEAQELRSRSQSAPSWDEVQELRKETEMFAGQVIEQDEEIEELKETLQLRDRKIQTLELELEDVQRRSQYQANNDNSPRVMDLAAELDEIMEANEVLRDEIRVLRRLEREYESSAEKVDRLNRELQQARNEAMELQSHVDMLSRQKADVVERLQSQHSDVQDLRATQKELSRLRSREHDLQQEILELKQAAAKFSYFSHASNVDEMEVDTLKKEVETLRRDLVHQTDAVASAKDTVRELENLLAERNEEKASALLHEEDELMTEVESLQRQLDEAREQLAELEKDHGVIEDFKKKLEEADEAREASEKQIVETFERKLSLVTLDKDLTIDKLRKELTEQKTSSAEEASDLISQIQQYEAQIESMKIEMAAELESRETRTCSLERALDAHEQLVSNMRAEMDHLQGSMENRIVNRREEIDSLHQEVADLGATISKQEREIRFLKGELEDKILAHDAKVTQLQETIDSLSQGQHERPDDRRNAIDLQMELRLSEVKDRLETMKRRNTMLVDENEALRSRLRKAEEKLYAGLSEVDRDRTVLLEEELDKQTMTVREVTARLARLTEANAALKKANDELGERKLATFGNANVSANSKASTSSPSSSSSPPPKEAPIRAVSPSPRKFGFLHRRRPSSTSVPVEEKR